MMVRKYRVLDADSGELLSSKPYVSLRDAKHVASVFHSRSPMFEVFNEKTGRWEQQAVRTKRNRSGSVQRTGSYYTNPNKSADENYSDQLHEWIYTSVRDNLEPNLGSTIAQSIANASADAAKKKYMEFVKRTRRR